ncbi:MAG: hypothetical protein QME74_09895 [Candidatus Edwardsbacteria bacterium]|nr:hypothetical protein [Candidatus Edwardsbacteria bacterium]
MQLCPLKCQSCGGNLQVGPQQVLAKCSYCPSGYEILGSNAVGFEQAAIGLQNTGEARLWLPFWLVEFNARVRRLEATEPAGVFDRAFDAGGDGGRARSDEIRRRIADTDHTLLAAAFRTNNFINYTADLSAAISRQWNSPALAKPKEDKDWTRCYYDHLDARKMALVLLRLLINKEVREIVELEFDPVWKRHQLVWWPFAAEGDCWKDMVYGIRVLKSAIDERREPA